MPKAATSVVESVIRVGRSIVEDDLTRKHMMTANTMKVVNREGPGVGAARRHRHIAVAVTAAAFLVARVASAAESSCIVAYTMREVRDGGQCLCV